MIKKSSDKGGRLSVSALVRLLRKTEAYEQWKRAVLIRDRFTCQQCGKRNGRQRIIEAHHLTGFTLLVRTLGVKTVTEGVENPALWEIGNGQTLCRPCHEDTDSFAANFLNKDIKKKVQI